MKDIKIIQVKENIADFAIDNPGMVNDEIIWHTIHGAVYKVYRGDSLTALVWLSLLPEDMCVLSYKIVPGAPGMDLIKGTLYVRDWLAKHYTTIIGYADEENTLGRKYIKRMGFEERGWVRGKYGYKMSFAYISPELQPEK